MAGPIQLIPPGLLGMFQLKTGRNPRDLIESVQPTLEMRDWYFLVNQRPFNGSLPSSLNVTTGMTGFQILAGAGGQIVVPEREVWWVRSFGIFAGVAVGGDSIQMKPAYATSRSGTLGSPPQFALTDVTAVATQNNSCAIAAHNFWLQSRSVLGVWVDDIVSAGGIIVSGYCEYTALQV